jgi:hypothetical protein
MFCVVGLYKNWCATHIVMCVWTACARGREFFQKTWSTVVKNAFYQLFREVRCVCRTVPCRTVPYQCEQNGTYAVEFNGSMLNSVEMVLVVPELCTKNSGSSGDKYGNAISFWNSRNTVCLQCTVRYDKLQNVSALRSYNAVRFLTHCGPVFFSSVLITNHWTARYTE